MTWKNALVYIFAIPGSKKKGKEPTDRPKFFFGRYRKQAFLGLMHDPKIIFICTIPNTT